MQRIHVIDSSTSDYLHDDEIIELQHLATRKRYRLLAKNLDEAKAEGVVGLYIPVSLIDNMIIEGDYCIVVLTESQDDATASSRRAKVMRMVRNYRDAV